MDRAVFRGGSVGIWLAWLALGASGCGGRSMFDAPGSSVAGGANLPASCPDAPAAVVVTRVWQTDAGTQYGVFGHGVFAFSSDGRKLVTPSDEYLLRGYSEYSSASGERSASRQVGLLGRDRAWQRELLAAQDDPFGPSALYDANSPLPLVSLQAHPHPTVLSDDGSSIAVLECKDGVPTVARTRATPLEVDQLEFAAVSCAGSNAFTPSYVPFAVTADAGAAAFAFDDSGLLWLGDFESGTVRSVRVSSPPPADAVYPAHFPVNVQFSPAGHFVAVAAGNEPLRVLRYPELTPALAEIPTELGQGFSYCYCSQRWFIPVAWSSDERWLATGDASSIVLRRACDGTALATIPLPDGQVAAYVAFAPDARALAVLSLDNTQMGSTLGYYDLSY